MGNDSSAILSMTMPMNNMPITMTMPMGNEEEKDDAGNDEDLSSRLSSNRRRRRRKRRSSSSSLRIRKQQKEQQEQTILGPLFPFRSSNCSSGVGGRETTVAASSSWILRSRSRRSIQEPSKTVVATTTTSTCLSSPLSPLSHHSQQQQQHHELDISMAATTSGGDTCSISTALLSVPDDTNSTEADAYNAYNAYDNFTATTTTTNTAASPLAPISISVDAPTTTTTTAGALISSSSKQEQQKQQKQQGPQSMAAIVERLFLQQKEEQSTATTSSHRSTNGSSSSSSKPRKRRTIQVFQTYSTKLIPRSQMPMEMEGYEENGNSDEDDYGQYDLSNDDDDLPQLLMSSPSSPLLSSSSRWQQQQHPTFIPFRKCRRWDCKCHDNDDDPQAQPSQPSQPSQQQQHHTTTTTTSTFSSKHKRRIRSEETQQRHQNAESSATTMSQEKKQNSTTALAAAVPNTNTTNNNNNNNNNNKAILKHSFSTVTHASSSQSSFYTAKSHQSNNSNTNNLNSSTESLLQLLHVPDLELAHRVVSSTSNSISISIANTDTDAPPSPSTTTLPDRRRFSTRPMVDVDVEDVEEQQQQHFQQQYQQQQSHQDHLVGLLISPYPSPSPPTQEERKGFTPTEQQQQQQQQEEEDDDDTLVEDFVDDDGDFVPTEPITAAVANIAAAFPTPRARARIRADSQDWNSSSCFSTATITTTATTPFTSRLSAASLQDDLAAAATATAASSALSHPNRKQRARSEDVVDDGMFLSNSSSIPPDDNDDGDASADDDDDEEPRTVLPAASKSSEQGASGSSAHLQNAIQKFRRRSEDYVDGTQVYRTANDMSPVGDAVDVPSDVAVMTALSSSSSSSSSTKPFQKPPTSVTHFTPLAKKRPEDDHKSRQWAGPQSNNNIHLHHRPLERTLSNLRLSLTTAKQQARLLGWARPERALHFCKLYYHMALLHFQIGRYVTAMHILDHAVETLIQAFPCPAAPRSADADLFHSVLNLSHLPLLNESMPFLSTPALLLVGTIFTLQAKIDLAQGNWEFAYHRVDQVLATFAHEHVRRHIGASRPCYVLPPPQQQQQLHLPDRLELDEPSEWSLTVARALVVMGQFHSQHNQRPDLAMRCLQDALSMQRFSLGDHHVQVAETLTYIGDLHTSQSLLVPAESCYQEALRIYQLACNVSAESCGGDAASVLASLGWISLLQHHFARAWHLSRHALDLTVQSHGPNHRNVASIQYQLGWLTWWSNSSNNHFASDPPASIPRSVLSQWKIVLKHQELVLFPKRPSYFPNAHHHGHGKESHHHQHHHSRHRRRHVDLAKTLHAMGFAYTSMCRPEKAAIVLEAADSIYQENMPAAVGRISCRRE